VKTRELHQRIAPRPALVRRVAARFDRIAVAGLATALAFRDT
jgi:hypothetical protein